MTLWRNESEDTVIVNFDLGTGRGREAISLPPGAEIIIPDRFDKYVPMEVPQLKVVTQVLAQDLLNLPKKRPGRKPKDTNGIQ